MTKYIERINEAGKNNDFRAMAMISLEAANDDTLTASEYNRILNEKAKFFK